MGRLYTEASIDGLPRGSELVLGAGDLATPSALDAAFAKGIRVRRGDGSAAGGEFAPAPGPWAAMLARDGTYVVQVRAGRATVHRLTEDGPAALAAGGPR